MPPVEDVGSALPNTGENETAVADVDGAAPATGSWRAFLLAMVAIYAVLGILYLLQRPIARIMVGCCFGRKRTATIHHSRKSNVHRHHSMHRMSSYCRRATFAIRTIFSWVHRDIDLDAPLDESKHQGWTTSQVACWAYTKLRNQHPNFGVIVEMHVPGGPSDDKVGGYEHLRAIQSTIATLKRQRIDGNSLAHLTLDHLIRFGIPFGIAVRLMTCIDELVPDRSVMDEENAGAVLPAWYESNGGAIHGHRSEEQVDEQGIEMSERAQAIMKDRFGMALPTLRGRGDPNDGDGDASGDNDLHSQMQHHPPERQVIGKRANYNNEPPSEQQANIENILSSMPPEVRAVAERRPDLVSKLLQERVQGQTTGQSPLALHAVSEEMDEYPSEEDIGMDSESVGLLRRRTNRETNMKLEQYETSLSD